MRTVVVILAWVARLLVTAFFCFVGYWKAFGSAGQLAEHHAWVAGFPLPFARAVGWSEIALGALLLTAGLPRLRNTAQWAAVLLAANQAVALLVHITRREFDAVPQNLVIIALLGFIIAASFERKHK